MCIRDSSYFTSDVHNTSDAHSTSTGDVHSTSTGDVHNTLTQELTQEEPKTISVDADAGGVVTSVVKRDIIFDWLAEHVYNVDIDNITKAVGARAGKTKRVLKEIHDANDTTLTVQHLEKFRQWWLREYSGLTMPRSAEKLAEYYSQFYGLMKQRQTKPDYELGNVDLSVKAQIALGYETVTFGLMNDEIRAKIKELEEQWTR